MPSKEVLIVEDDPKFRNSMRLQLMEDGYSFVEADSVDRGLEICRQRPSLKVVLLDLEFPEGDQDGREFLKGLGSDLPKYRIIVLTAHEEYMGAELAQKSHIFRYLHKPARLMESLRFTVSQAFNDIEREQLKDKNLILNKIQQQINKDILETREALDSALTLICESVRDLVGAYTVHIRVYDLQKGDFHLTAFAGPDPALKEIFTLPKRKGEALCGTIATRKFPINYEQLEFVTEFKDWKANSLRRIQSENGHLLTLAQEYFERVQSAYLAPITTRLFADEIDAVFNVSADTISFFSEEKQKVIMEFVGLATTAITNAWQKLRKEESHRDYHGISKVLDDVSKALGDDDTRSKIYQIVTDGISKIIKPEAISVYLYNKATEDLDNAVEFRGSSTQDPSPDGHPTDKGLTALVFSRGRPLRIPNLQTGDRRKPVEHPNADRGLYDHYVKLLPSGRVDHYLAVPMIIGEDVIGAVQVLNKKSAYYKDDGEDREKWLLERGFSDECENVLVIAASHLAVAIKNAELLEERGKQISQLSILKDVGRFNSSDSLDNLLKNIIGQAAEQAQAEICLLFLLDHSKSNFVLEQRYGISEKELPEGTYKIGEGITGRVAARRTSELHRANVPPGKYDREILEHLQKTYGQHKKIESLMIVPIMTETEVLGVIKIINKRGPIQHYGEEDLAFFEQFASYVGLALENMQRYQAAVKRLTTAESNSTLSSLVASVGHEVGHTFGLIPDHVLELTGLLPELTQEQGDLLDDIERLSNEMIYYANEISGYHMGEKECLDINTLLREAIHQIPVFRLPDNMEKIRVDDQISDEPFECLVDPNPLTRTIRNIMINAYQALDEREKGTITLRTYKNAQASMAMIEISDNGSGIKEEFKSRIYEPHFTTKIGKGTGIGLWLAQRHMDLISGTIDFISTEGEGTTFTLGIPLSCDSNAESSDV